MEAGDHSPGRGDAFVPWCAGNLFYSPTRSLQEEEEDI